jgi:hypothetical protein
MIVNNQPSFSLCPYARHYRGNWRLIVLGDKMRKQKLEVIWTRHMEVSSYSIADGCYYCGKPADTWDHVVPRKRGGLSTIDNLVPACRSCNSQKNARTLYEYRKHLQKLGLPCDFDTPDPKSIPGTRYQYIDFSTKFVSDDGSLVLVGSTNIYDRVYVNDK